MHNISYLHIIIPYQSQIWMLLSASSFLFFKFLIEVQLIYNILISAVQQSNSVTHTYIYSFPLRFLSGYWIRILRYIFSVLCSSLCYTLGPCCLSILYIIACICSSKTPSPSLLQPPPSWQPHVCSLCKSTSVSYISSSVSYFRFHM